MLSTCTGTSSNKKSQAKSSINSNTDSTATSSTATTVTAASSATDSKVNPAGLSAGSVSSWTMAPRNLDDRTNTAGSTGTESTSGKVRPGLDAAMDASHASQASLSARSLIMDVDASERPSLLKTWVGPKSSSSLKIPNLNGKNRRNTTPNSKRSVRNSLYRTNTNTNATNAAGTSNGPKTATNSRNSILYGQSPTQTQTRTRTQTPTSPRSRSPSLAVTGVPPNDRYDLAPPLNQNSPSEPHPATNNAGTGTGMHRRSHRAPMDRSGSTRIVDAIRSSSITDSMNETEEDLEAVGRFLRRGALAGWTIWIVLMFVTMRFLPAHTFADLDLHEKRSCWIMVTVLFVTNGSRLLPLAFQHNGVEFLKSGIITGTFSVQCMALLSNLLMATMPTPVMIDTISGVRIHMVRYATWVPLCFLMTFVTEAIDVPIQEQHGNIAWLHAIALALSTFAGYLFPFCTSKLAWGTNMAVSWMLFSTLYWRLYQRYQRFQALKLQEDQALLQAKQRRRNYSHRSINVLKEQVTRARYSFQIMVMCSISWTGIAVAFSLECILPAYMQSSRNSFVGSPEFAMISGHVLESISKIWYLSLLLNVYDRIFDESNRAVRRLEELRTLMSALWEASSDIMVICARTERSIHAVISPSALLQPTSLTDTEANMHHPSYSDSRKDSLSIMLEISPHMGTFCSFPVDLSKPVTKVDAGSIRQARDNFVRDKHFGRLDGHPHLLDGTAVEKNMTTIAHLAWQICEQEGLQEEDDHIHNPDSSFSSMSRRNHTPSVLSGDNTANEESWTLQELFATNDEGDDARVKCEAKVTHIDAGAILLVLRDVSERYQRFEIEKQLLEEVIVRKKDAEAIRFTRHEVKNGLLAAIGLVDSFREAYEKQRTQLLELQEWKRQQLEKESAQQQKEQQGKPPLASNSLFQIPVPQQKEQDEKAPQATNSLFQIPAQQQKEQPEKPPQTTNSLFQIPAATKPTPTITTNQNQEAHSSVEDLDTYMNDLDDTLRLVLDSILDNAMIREVLFEGYVPRRESVEIPQLLKASLTTRNSSAGGSTDTKKGKRKFPMEVNPEQFPHLSIDPQLVRSIYQHAISNACKYGKVMGDVKTSLKFDYSTKTFTMEIFNLPGYKHEALLNLSQDEIEDVFIEGTQLPANQCLETDEGKLASARSAGDGAWIMRKVAQCLGGICSIRFDAPGTTFSFSCPASVCETWLEKHQISKKERGQFALPENTWAVAVEDSAMQRKLLDRFLKKAGVSSDRCVSLGKDAEEIVNFTDRIRQLLEDNPDDKFLFIIDENLDIVEGGVVTKTVSGSFSIQQLLLSLSPVDDARVLALIRSANDSVQEVELYQARAHGFLLKGPMKKGGLLDEIKPWWIRRFQSPSRGLNASGNMSGDSFSRQKSSDHLFEDMSASAHPDDYLGLTRERILDLVKEVDVLCDVDDANEESNSSVSSHEDDYSADDTSTDLGLLAPRPHLQRRTSRFMDWQSIRYKLMLLNVDLKSNLSVDNFALAAKSIDEITNSSTSSFLPQDLRNRWLEIRALIFKELLPDMSVSRKERSA
ncbi:expressed unknown protein [Seminavis robusta]|uniref:Uncharacterized protein n=1 Tax=Seminavis robusta TaxID=568900 RepID=A0A9N8DBZ8_9STRA|nr:expressed unknown protein [Seminavis robusta]|eukprot:Sro53_g031320.1 n/a (1552) ;mRNA; r:28442-33300